MENIRNTRRAVCIIANNLCKEGLSKSAAFVKAWQTVKGHNFRAAGVTADRGQEKLSTLSRFNANDLQIAFKREPDNKHDSNAIQLFVKIKSLNKYCQLGYVPHNLAVRIAPVMDKGIKIKGTVCGVIGGYGRKENYGLLAALAI